MPVMQTSLQQVNAAFSVDKISSLSLSDVVDTSRDLADTLNGLPGVSFSADAVKFIRSWPTGIQAGILAAIHDNLSRPIEKRVPIVMSWTPGYDFSVSIWDVRNTESTHGELTIHLTSRYPTDAHPLG